MKSEFCGSIGCVALSLMMLGAFPAPVHAQPIAPIRAPGPAMMADARAAFERLDEATRLAIQEALIWTGDYAGVIDGTFGPRTFAAIVSHQIRERLPQNGILLTEDIDELLTIAEAEREAVGFALVDDPRTGVRIGIPLGLMARRADPSHGGARWQTPDERVTLDTRIFAPGDAELAGLFERLTGPSSGRQVNYKLLRDDFLVVSGETTGGKFYIRYDLGEAGIRGFSLGYDKALAQPYDWLTLAIAGSFRAFPSASPPSPPIALAEDGPFGTGVVVARNTILTSPSLDSCRSLRVADRPVTARERIGAVLLLTAEVDREPVNASSSSVNLENTIVITLAFAGSGVAERLTAIPGEMRHGSLVAPLQAGAAGAPVFRRNGEIVGVVVESNGISAAIAGIIPPRTHTLITMTDVAAFITVTGRPSEADYTAGAIAAAFGASLVAVFCAD
jgi:peptidoglycan hydrolase-like protein with peptidoglycan-binding domain